MIKRLSIVLPLLTLWVLGYAQSATIGGFVKKADGQPLLGATVVEKGTTNGAYSGTDGSFSLTVSDIKNAVLQVTYIGYDTSEVIVAGRTFITIVMNESAEDIGVIVVVGYGTAKEKELTGATSRVGGEDVQKLNVPRIDQALQGQVAGVNIQTNSGSPGGSSSIRIRGLSTFGDNDPLILVDGVVYDSEGLNALNPSDILSVVVLKDATAGIYGVRAANGVILIETKKGRLNSKPTFEFSSFGGIQQTSKKLSLLNATEYAILKNEMFSNGNDDLPFEFTQLGEGTNWQDSVFQNAVVQNYNFGITGGTFKTRYSIGASYYSQDGIVGGSKSNFTRMNGRVNLSVDLSDRLTFNSILLYTNESRGVLPEGGIGSVLYNTINAFPTDPIRDSNGRFTYLEEVSDIINPIAQMQNTYNNSYVNKFVGKEEFVFKVTNDLTFTNRFNYNVALVDNKIFSPLVWYGPGKAQNTALNEDLDPTQVEIASGTFIDRGASVYEGRSTYSDVNYEGFFNHNKTLKLNHILKTTLGVSVFARSGAGLGATAYNIPNNSVEYADISANLAPGGFLNNATSFQYQERLLSAFLRSEYNIGGKYILSGILRRDGSSKFGQNNRYGLFPTISGTWVVSREEGYGFDAVPFLKIRASYGVSGNDQIENFAYRALLNGEGVYVFDDIILTGVAIGRAANPDLKWETTRQANIGVDLTIMKNMDITVNLFSKNTRDLLFQPEVSGVLGASGPGGQAPVINAGDVSNLGIEFELAYGTTLLKDLDLNTSFNATLIRNRVVATPDGVEFLPGASFGVGGNVATRFEEGFPIGYFIGYKTDGVWQSQEEIDNSPVKQEGAKPGDLKFVDINGDGKINFSDASDKTMIGSPIPLATFGYNLNLRFRNIDFSANLFASIGQEIIRNYERQQPYANQLTYSIYRWTGPGSSTEYHRLTTDLTRNTVFSDYYVEDGSFLRLRNMQVGYSLPSSGIEKLNISSIRVYVAANNLFTLTKYQGFDPDIGSAGSTLSAGVDYGFYPQARTIMTGVTVKF